MHFKEKYLIILLICISCSTTEHGGKYVSYLENSSTHTLMMKYYNNGSIDTTKSLSLSPGQTLQVLTSAGSDGLFSYPTEIETLGFDSLIIDFDSERTSIQYPFDRKGSNPKAILYENPRNLFNRNNWTEKIIVEKKKRSEREYKFSFGEQDYLNAQEI